MTLITCVRRSIPHHAVLTLIQPLVVSKVDYCNSVLAGVSDTQLRQLQSVLNSAARLVFLAQRSVPITPLLCELHWLRVPERVTFWLCVLAFRSLHGTAPRYLTETSQLTTSCSSRCRLRSADMSTLIVPAIQRQILGDMRFQLRLPVPGTLCRPLSETYSHWRPFDSS